MAGQRKVHALNSKAVRLNKSLGDAVGLDEIALRSRFGRGLNPAIKGQCQ